MQWVEVQKTCKIKSNRGKHHRLRMIISFKRRGAYLENATFARFASMTPFRSLRFADAEFLSVEPVFDYPVSAAQGSFRSVLEDCIFLSPGVPVKMSSAEQHD